MTEKMKEMLDKLGYCLTSNRSMTTDEILDLFGMTVDSDGNIREADGNLTGYSWDEVNY